MIKVQNLCKMKTPALRSFLEKQLIKHEYTTVNGQNYLYAQGRLPVCLVAHMDTVHKTPPRDVFYDPKKRVMWSPDGLGADDRAGVWAILYILSKGYRPSVLFTDLEESGCVGAREAGKKVCPTGIKYVVEIDRRGYRDAVFYSEANAEFKKYVQSFGFEEEDGTYSDICELMDPWGVACVNVSAGYYYEHTYGEHLYLDDIMGTASRVMYMLSDSPNAPVFEHVEDKQDWARWYKHNGKGAGYVDWGTSYTDSSEGHNSWMYDKESNVWVSEDDPMRVMVQCSWCNAWCSPEEALVYKDEEDGTEEVVCPDCGTYVRSAGGTEDIVHPFEYGKTNPSAGKIGLFKNKKRGDVQ